jgi:hypothetical protein
MATTITFNANSAHSLLLTATGNGGSVSRSRADVLAACASGPLKEMLTRTGDWTQFNLTQAKNGMISVREVVESGTISGSTLLQFTWTAAGIAQLEIRLSHTSRY